MWQFELEQQLKAAVGAAVWSNSSWSSSSLSWSSTCSCGSLSWSSSWRQQLEQQSEQQFGAAAVGAALRDGSSHQGTVTSMEPNEGSFILHSESEKKGKVKPLHMVDVPGHSRLRPKLDEFLPQAAGLVFVVDALDFLPNCRAAAEYMYDILTKASIVKRKIPILLLCNKTDKVTAHSKDFIRKQLEKEIEKLRASRTAVSSADIADEYTLGVPGEAFAFSQTNNKVAVAEASGLTGEVSQLEQFIREYVKP